MLVSGGILALLSDCYLPARGVCGEYKNRNPLAHSAVRGAGPLPGQTYLRISPANDPCQGSQANIQMVGIILSGRGITFLGEFSGSTPLNGSCIICLL